MFVIKRSKILRQFLSSIPFSFVKFWVQVYIFCQTEPTISSLCTRVISRPEFRPWSWSSDSLQYRYWIIICTELRSSGNFQPNTCSKFKRREANLSTPFNPITYPLYPRESLYIHNITHGSLFPPWKMKNCRREPARSIFELASQSREGGELSKGMNIHDYNSSFNFRGAAVHGNARE